MDLPNIYAGDYRRLLIFPIGLLLLSAYFIIFVGVPQGIELKGGTLITLQVDKGVAVDEQAIVTALAANGVQDSIIQTYSNPVGEVVEIEIPQNELLGSIEKQIPGFNKQYTAAADAELELAVADEKARLSGTAEDAAAAQQARQSYDTVYGQFKATGDDLLGKISQAGGDVSGGYENARQLKELVDNSFASAREKYRREIVGAIGSTVKYSSYSFRDVSPTLSEYFISKAEGIVVLSAILTAIVVFAVFRTVIPSFAVLIGAASDVAIALGAMALFQIPLTLPSFAALLMLIGFSLDTDMLLTIRTLKRTEGTARERAMDTVKTGATMSMSAMVAFGALFILALITHIPTYYQISAVAICGLFGDLVATWGLNAVIVLWYAERKEKASGQYGVQ
jgi:preprotein translocase subunit SecF